MLAAVMSWSLFPLAFSLGGGSGAPLLSGGLWRLGVSLSGVSFLVLLFRPMLRGLGLLALGRLSVLACGAGGVERVSAQCLLPGFTDR